MKGGGRDRTVKGVMASSESTLLYTLVLSQLLAERMIIVIYLFYLSKCI